MSVKTTDRNSSEMEIEGIRWAFEHADLIGAFWFVKGGEACGRLRAEAQQARQQAEATGLRPLTQKRLRKLAQAKYEQATFIEELLSPLQTFSEFSTKIPKTILDALYPNQNLLSYIDNIHRDWVWGNEENQISVEMIIESLKGSKEFENIAFLGSGASRLAYDLSHQLDSQKISITDINPLLLLSAKKIMNQKKVKLYDFPIAPLNFSNSIVLNKLEAPKAISSNIEFIFADAMKLPFENAQCDLVITPWLIDIIQQKPEELIYEVSRVLRTSGNWIHFGPLGFDHENPQFNYSIEELIEVAKSMGFECEYQKQEIIPYMKNPASQHSRQENVFCLNFRKISDTPKPTSHSELDPAWLINPKQPIPRSEKLDILHQSHAIYSGVLSQVDGKTGLEDLAKRVAPVLGLSEADAIISIKSFFTRIKKDI